jgi:hypothetical protein
MLGHSTYLRESNLPLGYTEAPYYSNTMGDVPVDLSYQ